MNTRITSIPWLAVALVISTGCAPIFGGPSQAGAGAATSRPDSSTTRRPTFAERRARFADHKARLLAEYDVTGALLDLDDLFSPGVGRDDIPPLTRPPRHRAAQATFPSDEGRVVEVVIGAEAVAYPLAILSEHELVNDEVGGVPVAVSYCPLCDSVTVVDRRLPPLESTASDPIVVELGVSGFLYRSNLVMYDRRTRGLWSQVQMRALTGPFAGGSLVHLPVHVVRFDRFKARHPDGLVLSADTGFDGTYTEQYYEDYFQSERLYMPVVHGSALPPKTLGLGVVVADEAIFIAAEAAADQVLRVSTVSGPVRVTSRDGGMEVIEAPEGTRSVQTFYFAFSAFHPDARVIGP